MSYAYLVVTLDKSHSPPRVLCSAVHAASARTLPHLPDHFLFDVMTASGQTFEAAKRNLYTMSKVATYASETRWAFLLLSPEEFAAWNATVPR